MEDPQQPRQVVVPPQNQAPVFASACNILRMVAPGGGADGMTRYVIMEFLVDHPAYTVCVARVAIDREGFAGLLKYIRAETEPGKQLSEFV